MSSKSRALLLAFALLGLGASTVSSYVHYKLLTDPSYVSFCDVEWSILGRMTEARDDVCEDADVVHSVKMVLLWAMHELCDGRWLAGFRRVRVTRPAQTAQRTRGVESARMRMP